MAAGLYTAQAPGATVSTAITLVEVTAGSTHINRVHAAWLSNGSSTTSAAVRPCLLRKTATITGTAVTPAGLGNPSATSTAKRTATAEGTDGALLYEDAVNIVGPGWLYLPPPERRPVSPPSGLVAVKFLAAPTSATYVCGIDFEEIG